MGRSIAIPVSFLSDRGNRRFNELLLDLSELGLLEPFDRQSGQRAEMDIPTAGIMWFGIYMLHALVTMGLCSFPLWFLALLLYQFEQWFGLLAHTTVVGLALGVWMAE